jgi:hypothetical protein
MNHTFVSTKIISCPHKDRRYFTVGKSSQSGLFDFTQFGMLSGNN